MNTIKMLMSLFTKKKHTSTPLLIIRKETDLSRTREDATIRKFKSIEEAITELENDSNVPSDKIEKLKSSLKNLKNKTSIKIRNGEII